VTHRQKKRKANDYPEREKYYSDRDSNSSRHEDRDRDSHRRDRSRERDRESRYSSRDDYRRAAFDSRYNPDWMFQQHSRDMMGFPPFVGHPMANYSQPPPPVGASFNSSQEPCSTLYVTGLPKDVTERELSMMFRLMAGFFHFRLVVRDGKAPLAFADFVDSQSAAIAMQFLQGFRMDLKDSQGLYIEFDKNHRKFKKNL